MLLKGALKKYNVVEIDKQQYTGLKKDPSINYEKEGFIKEDGGLL